MASRGEHSLQVVILSNASPPQRLCIPSPRRDTDQCWSAPCVEAHAQGNVRPVPAIFFGIYCDGATVERALPKISLLDQGRARLAAQLSYVLNLRHLVWIFHAMVRGRAITTPDPAQAKRPAPHPK